MGQKVSNFFKAVGTTILKAGVTAAGSFIPVVGGPLASYINSKYKKGGMVRKCAAGELLLPKGVVRRAISSPAGLIALIRQYPNEARLSGLTLEDVSLAQEEIAGRKDVKQQSYEGEGAGRSEAQAKARKFKKGGRVKMQPVDESAPQCALGGVAHLPVSNLDRLDRMALGGAAVPQNQSSSYVQLRHGHPAERGALYGQKKFC